MCSPIRVGLLLIFAVTCLPNLVRAADIPTASPAEAGSSVAISVEDKIPTLMSVNLTAMAGHAAGAAQTTQTKLKPISKKTKVILVTVAVAVTAVIVVIYIRQTHWPWGK